MSVTRSIPSEELDTALTHIAARPYAHAVIERHERDEAFKRDAVGDALSKMLYAKPLLELEPREIAAVRYVALFAIRRLQPAWHAAAQKQAIKSVEAAMAGGEIGRTVGHLPEEMRAVAAAKFAPRVIAAYFGVLENSIPQQPADYLRLVSGGL